MLSHSSSRSAIGRRVGAGRAPLGDVSRNHMPESASTYYTSKWPDWVRELRNQGIHPYYSASGHAWIRFHKKAFTRFPTLDLAPVSKAEEREKFFKVKAPVISHHCGPGPDETNFSLLRKWNFHSTLILNLSHF